jgi:acyl-coenzyme A thioesterase PaaI-like protein
MSARIRTRASRALAALASVSVPLVAAASPAPAPSTALPTSPAGADHFSPIDLSSYVLTHHLLHEALAGDEKLERYELHISADKRSLRADVRLGPKACGHPRWIHGGAIASVFDDAMGTLFLSSSEGTGFTANLNVDYRSPVPEGTELRVLAFIDRVETGKSGARKVFLSARMEAANAPSGTKPKLFAEARTLFIVKTIPVEMKVAYVQDAVWGFFARAWRSVSGGGGGRVAAVVGGLPAGSADSRQAQPGTLK